MASVKEVFITKEVAERLGINASYLIRVGKELLEQNVLLPSEMRAAGKRNYLFNENAIEKISNKLNK